MKCSVFIATSVDAYIADKNGGVDWLHTAGDPNADMGNNADMGFARYLSSVDCMVMGRKCMDMIASMNLTPEQWPYGSIKVVVLSHTLKQPPKSLKDKVEMYGGDITDLVAQLEQQGFNHAYIDGGATITSFLNQKLINEITITQAPVLLGQGIPLLGRLDNKPEMAVVEMTAFANNFVQIKYHLNYS